MVASKKNEIKLNFPSTNKIKKSELKKTIGHLKKSEEVLEQYIETLIDKGFIKNARRSLEDKLEEKDRK